MHGTRHITFALDSMGNLLYLEHENLEYGHEMTSAAVQESAHGARCAARVGAAGAD